ncbi:DNRLRE domain-containing protein [Emticicia sp.]|uniref:DNRLRE domain-containing protein n=1 Tax=Emticicia sp. TaxID=1930953 RepID=UPI0037531354
MKNLLLFIICFGLLPLNSISQTFTVDFFPEKDNSIFSENINNSNGAGTNLFSGRTQGTAGTEIRRALVKFNITSLPANAQIESATLQIAVTNSANSTTDSHNFSIHKVINNWGEGASIGLGKGSPAQINDATWLHSFYNYSNWISAGGDYMSNPSASAFVKYGSVDLEFGIWSSNLMTNDITNWISSPSTNFGWIIIGEESTIGSAKRFSSREETIFPKPTLTITYSLPIEDKILINEVNPSKKWIEFYNPSVNTINLANYWLTNGALSDNINGGNVMVLNGNLVLNAGKYVVVSWTNLGQNTGEIALFNKNPTDNAAIMKDYVQYGAENQSKATAAVTAQVWDNATAFLPANIMVNTYSLNPTGNFLSGKDTNSTSWLVQKETPSYKNEICPALLTLSGTLIEATYQSIGQLKSTGSISANQNIKLNSEKSIVLENLFFVNSGAVFEAKIGGCNN